MTGAPGRVPWGGEALAHGRKLLAAQRYEEARAALEQVLEQGDDPDVLVDLATACRVLDDVPAAVAALERAYRLHVGRDEPGRAARDALVLADLAVDHLGSGSVAKGWLARAGQHLETAPECAEHVHVSGLEAYVALAYDKDPARAREHAERSVRTAHRLGDAVAVIMGNAYLGLIEVSLGELGPGMRLLEAGATAASAGELPPSEALDAYCLLITACERVRDVERVREWSARVLSLAERHSSDGFSAFARTRYAHALLQAGEWESADAELDTVLRDGRSRPLTAAMGLVLRSTLRRLQGHLDEAAELLDEAGREPYRRAVRHLVVESRAALELARGDAVAAADLAERYLRMVSPSDVIERVGALETLVRARLAEGDTGRAQGALEELVRAASRVPTPGVRGAALLAEGLVTAADRPEVAVERLLDATDLLDGAGLVHDAAAARVALAGALRSAGRADAARREAQQAVAEAERLGAAPLVDAGRRVLAPLRTGARVGPDELTPRETEVLRLAAAGLANAEIAEKLVLSVRTVERHLSNVYLKVGATGPAARALAIAHGQGRGLL